MVKQIFSLRSIGPKDPNRRFAVGLAAAVLFLFFAAAITTLARQALVQIQDLNTANSDNLQWTLSQTEVEFLQYYNAVVVAEATPNADLAPLRRWYDIFYSRMNVIMGGPVYGKLAEQPHMAAEFARINAYMSAALPYIDGPDAALRAQLTQLREDAAARRIDVRNVSLEGIRVFSKLADEQRLSVSETMARIAMLTVGLIMLLLLAVFFLARIYGVTRRQAIENKATRDRLQAMLNTSLDAVLVVDREGCFLEFNGAATEIFGYSEAEALGVEMTKLIFAEHHIAAHNEGMRRHLTTGEQRIIGKGRVQMQAKRKSGEVFPVELSVAKTMSQDGEIFVSYLRDISDRITAEQRLTKARDDALAGERAKARFMAVMSHEMRTPLNGLLGSLDLLKGTPLSSKQAEFVEVMQKSGELLLHHVTDVLDIARLESGRMVGDNVALNLDDLVQDVLESQAALAQAKGLTLRYRPESGAIGMIMGSALGLRQVLLNLVSNAIKFTEHGLVELQAAIVYQDEGDANPRLSLRVRDTGIGIALADQARVFDDFVTLDSSFGRRADGTGLGLGIARRIVQSMGGEIGVVSQPKLGATFWIDLPYRRPAVTHAAPAPAAPSGKVKANLAEKSATAITTASTSTTESKAPTARKPKSGTKTLDILVVEDNQINRFILREMLVAAGHRVTEAVDGLEGVQLAQKRHFDLIFMDICMPTLDGIAATVRLRAGTGPCANVPIIALTAHALPDDRALFLASGMNAVLNKPLDRDMLLQVLENASFPPKPEQKIKSASTARSTGAASKNAPAADAPARNTPAQKTPAPRTPRRAKPIHPHVLAAEMSHDERFHLSGDVIKPNPPKLPILRASTLEDLKAAIGAERLTGLTSRFLTEGATTLSKSESALREGDLPTAQAMVHSLAGSAATFGALALQAHLAQMETDLKAQNGAAAQAALPQLSELLHLTENAMTRQMAS